MENKNTDAKQKLDEVEKISNSITELNQNYEEEIKKITEFVNESDNILQSLNATQQNIETTNNSVIEIFNTLQNYKTKSLERRNEIKDLHNEIFGTVDEDGEETEGLKNELDSCYNDLSNKITVFSEELNNFRKEKENEYTTFINKKEIEFNDVKSKIESLLPGAMSAGLSSAYNKKRRQEEKSKLKSEMSFNLSILGLVFISVIPVFIASVLFFKFKKDIVDIIDYLPKLLGLIMPIYAPVVWIALTSSKKVNQSKRLIEEYAHKEAISKTYEGLSREVNKLEGEDNLKEKLLYNLIMTSSENPGKLIKGFNNPDHPMLEIVDKCTTLVKSVKSPDELQTIIDGIVSLSKNVAGLDSSISEFVLPQKKKIEEDDDEEEEEDV